MASGASGDAGRKLESWRCRGRNGGQARRRGTGDKNALLCPGVSRSETFPARATPPPRGPRAGLSRRLGSALGLDCSGFLFKVLSLEGPVSRVKWSFDGPVDRCARGFSFGGSRPLPAVRGGRQISIAKASSGLVECLVFGAQKVIGTALTRSCAAIQAVKDSLNRTAVPTVLPPSDDEGMVGLFAFQIANT
jgi:hypothetical protein